MFSHSNLLILMDDFVWATGRVSDLIF